MLLGLSATGFGSEVIASLRVGQPINVGPYQVVVDSVGIRAGPNYQETVAPMTIRSGGVIVAKIEPARRRFATRQMETTEAGIVTLNFGQIYISITDPADDGTIPARLYWKPLVTFIWLGAVLMAFAGVLSLADRRLRIGAPARARSGAGAVAAAE